MLLTIYGTEWPILCWCAVKKLVTSSDQSGDQSCVTLITWSQCSGTVTFLYLISSNWQRTGNCRDWRALWVWRISQHLNKQLVIIALADMLQLRQHQSALTVVELVLWTSVSTVIVVSIYGCTTTTSVQRHHRNRRTTSSKQASNRLRQSVGCYQGS